MSGEFNSLTAAPHLLTTEFTMLPTDPISLSGEFNSLTAAPHLLTTEFTMLPTDPTSLSGEFNSLTAAPHLLTTEFTILPTDPTSLPIEFNPLTAEPSVLTRESTPFPAELSSFQGNPRGPLAHPPGSAARMSGPIRGMPVWDCPHKPLSAIFPVMNRPSYALLLAALLAACGEVTGGTGGIGPSASQALELTLALEDEVESATAALTVARLGTPPVWTPPAGCPTVQGSTDTDSDGILDNATLTFTAPPCELAFRRGALQVTGVVEILDPNFANNQGFNLTYDDLTWAYVDSIGDRDYAATRNGTRARLGSSNAATLTTGMTIVRQRPGRANATVTLDLTHAFTAATPGTLLVGQPIPSGSLSITGTAGWRRSTEDWSLTVATPVPLAYSAACTVTPRLTAGVLTLTGTISGESGVLQFNWSQCGVEPVRTWTPTP